MSRIVKEEKDCLVDAWLEGEFCESVCVIFHWASFVISCSCNKSSVVKQIVHEPTRALSLQSSNVHVCTRSSVFIIRARK
jgi:hypothetical protein